MMFIKDRYNVSGGAYHELSQVCKGMPRHYKLKDRICELNKLWNIKPTPMVLVVYNSPLQKGCNFICMAWYVHTNYCIACTK